MSEIVVEFAATSQALGPLQEAAYRLIGEASCRIESDTKLHRCRLEPAPRSKRSESELRTHFIDLVTDENLRAKLARETEPVRNLLLSLAFGALARESEAGHGEP